MTQNIRAAAASNPVIMRMMPATTSIALLAAVALAQPPTTSPAPTHADWLRGVLQEISAIKPGITRRQFEQTFTMDGGIQSGRTQRYCYRDAPCIEVDAAFIPSTASTQPFDDPDARLDHLSKPYLETPFYD